LANIVPIYRPIALIYKVGLIYLAEKVPNYKVIQHILKENEGE